VDGAQVGAGSNVALKFLGDSFNCWGM
jgi:hypothetical protein